MKRALVMLSLVFAILAVPFASSAGGPSYCVGPAGVTILGKRTKVLPETCVPCTPSVCAKLPTCLPLVCGNAATQVETTSIGR